MTLLHQNNGAKIENVSKILNLTFLSETFVLYKFCIL